MGYKLIKFYFLKIAKIQLILLEVNSNSIFILLLRQIFPICPQSFLLMSILAFKQYLGQSRPSMGKDSLESNFLLMIKSATLIIAAPIQSGSGAGLSESTSSILITASPGTCFNVMHFLSNCFIKFISYGICQFTYRLDNIFQIIWIL